MSNRQTKTVYDYKININPIGIKNPLWSQLISLTHDINSGGRFYNIKSF